MGRNQNEQYKEIKTRQKWVFAASLFSVLLLLVWWQLDEGSLRALAFRSGTGVSESAVEDAQVLLLLAALVVAVSLAKSVPHKRFAYWSIGVVLLFVVGEELSWGQHYFGWDVSEGWGAINSQDETTLHNLEVFQENFWFLGRFNTLFVIVAVGSAFLGIAWALAPKRLSWLVPDWSLSPLFLACAGIHWGTALSQSRWGLPGNAALTVSDWEIGEFLLYLGLLGWLLNQRAEQRETVSSGTLD